LPKSLLHSKILAGAAKGQGQTQAASVQRHGHVTELFQIVPVIVVQG
jgi:hypothetical protein